MGDDIVKYSDAAMYDAQPILGAEEGVRLRPRVFLLNATPDPLGTCAADMRMYRGDPVYSLDEITDEQRRWAWEELSKTILNTPLEGVSLKFMIEAVTRSFTHQMVRQRVGAYYVQESLRFAVKRGLAQEVALPPSIVQTDEGVGKIWHDTIATIETAYQQLVDAGVPAEDARGLLPHAVTTRIIYHTNLRGLFNEAGKRLCTQAQFEWRHVFLEIMKAIRGYCSNAFAAQHRRDDWQWQLIGTPAPTTFTPVCYHTGSCQFMSMLDRGCTIRDRVQAFAASGVPSSQWHQGHGFGDKDVIENAIDSIQPEEWMADPTAGVTTETNRPE
jgi:flavin-dependent thymidylate synthase